MKVCGLCFLGGLMFLGPLLLAGDTALNFKDYFVNETMRLDYYHTGNASDEIITLDQIYRQGSWAGNPNHLLDEFNLGRYQVKVYDAASGVLIFSRGFDSYFGEYRTTEPAGKGIKRTYHESALIPCPRKKVRFVLEARGKDNSLKPIFEQEVDPASYFIIHRPTERGVKVIEALKNGDPHTKVDIGVVAEGYTAAEEGKLRTDLDRLMKVLFAHEPFKTYRGNFNIVCAFRPSDESGCTEPSHGSYKNTSVGSTFDSLGSERYLLTEENRRLRDIAAAAPYDFLLIMVNHKRYGGGGIYNLYCTFTTGNQWYGYLLVHELGHHFAGLADEYYTSATAYDSSFYPQGFEPLEPNITALADPANAKWKGLLAPGIAVPTPWEKDAFDKMDLAYQKIRQELNEKIGAMKRGGAPSADVAKLEDESEKLSRDNAAKVDQYLRGSKYLGQVGVFEGAGYQSRGLYRPMIDCIMFTKGEKPFCKVCEQAIIQVIRFYSE